MIDDPLLVKKLRHQAKIEAVKYEDAPHAQLEWKAADEIERLRAEVNSLAAQCESYRESFAGTVQVNDNLRAENAKLRATLFSRLATDAPIGDEGTP